ncbi:hypothetical protein BBJ28_00014316 [Nothophytophthora sp. Chile5]|nr:hypothetical protein BBJ28_00014316 [Nothophytophthora sp. Chile5]
MDWVLLAAAALALSAAATALVVFKLYRNWDVRASSVRWLFAVFFAYQSVYAIARFCYYVWMATQHDGLISQDHVDSQLSGMGISAGLAFAEHNGWILIVIITLGDTAHFSLTVWILALVYELSKLVARSMDRGETNESAKIRWYAWAGHVSVLLFLSIQTSLVIAFTGYSTYAYAMVLLIYVLQIAALVYMVVMVVLLKIKGRNYESVHGRSVASPIYRRLQWIILTRLCVGLPRIVYALFAFQFQLSAIIMFAMPKQAERLGGYARIRFVIYYLRGFVLSVVTGCSQPCVLRFLGCCVPAEVHTRLTQRRERREALPTGWTAPYINPVFVFTDIESSSALWAVGDGRVMQLATQVHDDILRASLTSYRGYEITTAGDSFQLAFHTIEEATAYCMEVQMRLLAAKWPKELHGLVPATRKVRSGTRLIFRGLRVRMGIHDAVGSEGSLIQHVHAVTRKLTYTGASEVIANEIGDLGAGGQILVTKRVAERLIANASQFTTKFTVEPVCEYSIPRVNALLQVFQVVPKRLAMRCDSFHSRGPARHEYMLQIDREENGFLTESQTFVEFLRFSSHPTSSDG